MPITLGCPSCGKRFRARDESAGKRVKCPYCQAAVPVPSSDESAHAGAPTEVVPAEPSPFLMPASSPKMPPARPSAPPSSVPVASPDEWGAGGEPLHLPPEPKYDAPRSSARTGRPVHVELDEAPAPPKTRGGKKSTKADAAAAKTPEQLAAPGWRKTKGGLMWVMLGLFLFAIPGFVPFGKKVYERAVGDLPTMKDPGKVKIEGYVNTPDTNAVQISQIEEIDILGYGVPFILGGLCLTLGRLTAGAAPRDSGAKGLFAFSGMFTLLGVTALVTYIVCKKLGFGEARDYAWVGFLVGAVLAEFWFLIALAATGATMNHPSAVRGVGRVALLVGIVVIIQLVGWDEYAKWSGRPRNPPAASDWLLFEAAAILLGWLILIGTYYRAVKRTRSGIRHWLLDYDASQPAKR